MIHFETRLVFKVKEDNIQQRLLSEKVLTFDECLKISVSIEIAKNMTTVHKFGSMSWYRCGKNHSADECNFMKAKFFSCEK